MKKLFLVVFILCFAGSIFAQNKTNTVEEYKKRIQHNFNKYNSAINKKYSDYLRGIWERYNAYAPFTIPDEDITPVIYEEKDTITINEITIDQDDLLNIKQHEHDIPSPLTIDIKKDEIEEYEDNKTFSISFYNTAFEIHWNNFEFELNSCSNQSIGDAWDNFSETSYLKHTIYDCLAIKEKYNLCDWAYLSLIHQISETIYNKTNNAVLLSAYFLEQSGYDIKLGRIHDKLYLLFSSEYEIYNHCYYTVDNVKYYPYYSSDDLNEMEICETPDKSQKSISLYIDKEQIFCKEQLKQRSITFENSQRISISINENLLDFYSSYPTSRINGNDMTRWAMYAQTPLNATTREELYKQLASLVAGKDELEAANILLNFVQVGFTYKYDEEVWGEDRAFFAEESLAYTYCDCEDRSILFSHIIRDLLELEVALVYSPGHLFTAVKFSNNVEGAYITINNEKYVVCEPTCTNGAPVGWSAIEEGCEDIELILLSKIKYGKSYKLSFNNITNYQKSLFPICINGKYGYKNNENKIIIPCEYDSLGDSKQGDLFFYVAVRSNKMYLFDFNGRCYASDIEDYIPLEIHTLFDSGYIGDYCAIVKEQGKWYFKDLNSRDPSIFFYEFCLDEYYMNDVTFENNIYCEPQGENKSATGKYIILKKKSNNKYGVLLLHNSIDSGNKIYIPFEYDKISFVDNDKSKVTVYNSKTNEYKIISLK